MVILSFINSSPYQNDTPTNENRFDNSVEALDYDLNPFETHESLQAYNTPMENSPPTTLTGSSTIQISTFPEEDEDYDLNEDFLETTTLRTSTPKRSTSTTQLISTSTTTMTPSTTQSTTTSTTLSSSTVITQIFTEPTTLPTTTTTVKTTLPTIPTLPFIYTNSPIITERTHHTGRKSHNKSRKHNHKKHHKHQPIHELDDLEDIVNPEFKVEDFDPFDQEPHKLESNRSTRRKNKNSSKSSSEQRSTTRNFDSMERPRTTQKITTELPKPTAAKPQRPKESEVLIVKPEPTPEVPILTTAGTNSKIIEIKAKSLEAKKTIKRSIDDDSFEDDEDIMLMDQAPSVNEDVYIIKEEHGDVISPAALISSVPNFTQSSELEGIGGFLQGIVGLNDKFEPKQWFQKSPSLEFINLALALLVWSVRYPSVFWDSSKAFTMIFSLQMIANSIDILMLHVGTSILFKLQIVGQFMTVQNQPSPLLLNGIVTLALTLLAYVLIIASSMILYLYGHSRLAAKIRDCQMITLKDGDIWSYFSHCASLCFILALSVVKAPIIHDLTVTYRISLDGTIFASSEFSY